MTFKIEAQKRMLEAMSITRSKAEERIESLSYEFAQHVIKVYLYPNESYVKHWLLELNAWYTRIHDAGCNLKGGKKLKAADYKKFMYSPSLAHFDSFTDRAELVIAQNENIKPKDFLDFADMHIDFDIFYTLLSKHLENNSKWSAVKTDLLKFANN